MLVGLVLAQTCGSDWFEMSELYCLACQDKGRTWLRFTTDLDRDSEGELRKAPQSGIVNLTVTGRFETGGTFGHLNGYQHQFTASKIRGLAVVARGPQSIEQRKGPTRNGLAAAAARNKPHA